ncbi:hypothetical protein IKQ38_04845 [Candidatus Saccharibacteria bacterium]|nr:hypothetical protein [Candidatus Saccharibacteria bacterium]
MAGRLVGGTDDRLALGELDNAVTAFAVEIDGGFFASGVAHHALGELDEFFGPDAVEGVVVDRSSGVVRLAHVAADVDGEALSGLRTEIATTLRVARNDVGSEIKIACMTALNSALDDVVHLCSTFGVAATDGDLGIVRAVAVGLFVSLDHIIFLLRNEFAPQLAHRY